MFQRSPDPADIAACRKLLSTGSRTFHLASLVLPHRVRAPASALYAFCRLADDAVDVDGGRSDAIGTLEARLDRIYAGLPHDCPVDRAVADTVERFAIPKALPAALIEGLRWDVEGRRFEDISALHDYAARVAGSVGAMMALLMGVRDPVGLARACDLGVAMQLSNIARDIGEDARNGRIYLPLAWLREAGIDAEALLAAPQFRPELGEIVIRLLDLAEAHYARGLAGVAMLPRDCRYGIRLAGRLYAEIGREVGRRGGDSVAARVTVGPARKLALAAGALAQRDLAPVELAPLAETRFLVDAVASRGRPAPAPDTGRIAWLVDLFARLEQRDYAR